MALKLVVAGCVVVFGGICVAAWVLLDAGSAAAYNVAVLTALFCSLVPTVAGARSRGNRVKERSEAPLVIHWNSSSNDDSRDQDSAR